MSKRFFGLTLALSLSLLPSFASAQGSVLDEIDANIAALADVDAGLLPETAALAQQRVRVRTVGVTRYYHSAVPRPHIYHRPVVVVERPQPVIVQAQPQYQVAPQAAPQVVNSYKRGHAGIGLRFAGLYLHHNQARSFELNYKMHGGIGYYIKIRPSRWLSVEFINDIHFGQDSQGTSYLRTPIALGLQAHFFDYGMLDVYAVAAASLTFVLRETKDRVITTKNKGYEQFGGQFGLGASIILGAFEIGAEARYTIDNAPNSVYNVSYGLERVKNRLSHGVLFSGNIGLAF